MSVPTELNAQLERTILIEASPATVFAYFTDSALWARWWGEGSSIDARPGGAMRILYPGNNEALGEVVAVEPPHRIVFTYGYASGEPIAAGASQVTITLRAVDRGTELELRHAFADPAVRATHIQGWRFQLALFANLVTDTLHAEAAALADAWYAVWAETDSARRGAELARIATPDIRFRDRFGHTNGHADLHDHIAAAQHYMPGVTVNRQGAPRHCQGTLLCDWIAKNPQGATVMAGATVFSLTADGRFEAITTLPPPAA